MPNKNRDSRNFNNDREQPDGWFDPERYRENRERRNDDQRSNYQQTSNPNLSARYDELNRRRMQANYPDRNAFERQYGNRGNNQGYNSQHYNNRDMNNDNIRRSSMYGDDYVQPARIENNGRSNYSGRDHDRDDRYDDQQENRDWWDKASDEVASWFGNDEAEQRRRMDKLSGPHRGKGPKGYMRTDDRIREDINECLYHDSYVDASEVEIKVENGEAIVTGTVDSRESKRRIEDIIERIPGIRDVENRLKVSQSSTPSGSTDRQSGERWTS